MLMKDIDLILKSMACQLKDLLIKTCLPKIVLAKTQMFMDVTVM